MKDLSRYVQRASSPNVTVSNHRLRWAVDGMRLTAPLPAENWWGGVRPFVQGGTHTHTRAFSKTDRGKDLVGVVLHIVPDRGKGQGERGVEGESYRV